MIWIRNPRILLNLEDPNLMNLSENGFVFKMFIGVKITPPDVSLTMDYKGL